MRSRSSVKSSPVGSASPPARRAAATSGVDRNELIGQCSVPRITSTTAARPTGTAPLPLPYSSMSPASDQPPPPPKPKYTAQEQRVQREERRKTVRLRMAIWQELDDRGITTPDDIGAALGMLAAEAIKLLTRHVRFGQRSIIAAAVSSAITTASTRKNTRSVRAVCGSTPPSAGLFSFSWPVTLSTHSRECVAQATCLVGRKARCFSSTDHRDRAGQGR
jgi:pyruvate/2-oxoglutarate dehydrogenase complex dihydrolipoamide acyltransferase (E2) component